MSDALKPRTLNIVTAALGGEGGGVFTNWLTEVAGANDWLSQATSIAGVAQRTGATIYYVELFPRDQVESRPPVMSLFPAQGDIDIAVSSEIAEAGRMLQRGFVTPDRTTLISSTHRVYGITEKINLADGTIDEKILLQVAKKYAKEFISYDMQKLALHHHAVISAVLLGALAGSGALPFGRQSFEDVIRKTGKAVDTNLAAFAASYQTAKLNGAGTHEQDSVQQFDPGSQPESQPGLQKKVQTAQASKEDSFQLPAAKSDEGRVLLDKLQSQFPESVHFSLYHGLQKTFEYQDVAYATQYINELESILEVDQGDDNYALTNATAIYLALWMCFEDVSRVAQLKIRAARMGEIRAEVQAEEAQIVYVTEYFRPRPEEICAILPAALGAFMLSDKVCRSTLNWLLGDGRKLRTNTLFIQLTLRFLTIFGRFRRASLGYRHEHQMIQTWLSAVKSSAQKDMQMAIELANCGRLVKGYGDTRSRTTTQLSAIVDKVHKQEVSQASTIAQLYSAAVADDESKKFQEVLNSL